jgi:5'-3' exonuclease
MLNDMKINRDTFLSCCITAGCDYLKNVRGIGINTAFKMHTQDPAIDVFADFAKRGAAPDYRILFERAKSVFLHQTIFDPVNSKTTCLREWPTTPSQDLQNYTVCIQMKRNIP